jgi:hypothetical protein
MRTTNDLVFDAVAVSGTDAFTTSWIPAESMYQFSIQAVTTGSNPNGTLKAQFSNDNPTSGSPSNATDITSATVSTTNNGVYAIQKTDICAQWLRFVYTNASGSGVLSARIKTNGY